MMRILILGAAGMAGHVIYGLLKPGDHEVLAHARTSASFGHADYVGDLCEHKLLDILLRETNPDVVINCVGLLVKASQERPDLATYINAFIPRRLELLGPEIGFRTIQLSTDCVFTGKDGGYTERSPKDESKPYGLSKSLGEIVNDRDCTIRTSIIGPELKRDGTGLLEWFLRQENYVYGYTDAYWNGVTTLELAIFIRNVIEHKITGLKQIASSNNIQKFELLTIINNVYSKYIKIYPKCFDNVIDKTLVTSSGIPYTQRPIDVQLSELKLWYEENVKWLSTSA